ncbi:MAG: glycoside hydrolase family 97 catalytic domain-containing protein [Candidatus Pseudobacter hemicellulosilyticus]|uniref:Glycoside hydrolase family 97 catalytic domain-containing protein n=1 Tax=Candidatus Pseudobacter hemicellulosilyticus TaxID=3121375 RepID=A0AAJ6BI20_9BACT|nr:MAG: glycoside hydrolase family 97 catalytic domain-containing protein [Pseudobacter sp.]
MQMKYPAWICLALLILNAATLLAQTSYKVQSPDKKLTARFFVRDEKAGYQLAVNGQPVLLDSRLGLVTSTADLSTGLTLESASKPIRVRDQYVLKNAKRSSISVDAWERRFTLRTTTGQKLVVIFRLSNDGLAFRYALPGTAAAPLRILEEQSSFHFPANTRGWLQPMADAKTGWEQTNPSYEEYYQKDIPAGTASPTAAGWVFPALFKTGDNWVLLSEAGLDRSYSATRLQQHSSDNEYRIGFPQAAEVLVKGAKPGPVHNLPWETPWRIIAAGSLKTLVESTLGTDLAAPAIKVDTALVRPGKAAWSWAIYKDDSTVYGAQKRFIDYAHDMNWEYCLVDALWDTQIGYDKIKELASYAAAKKVGLLLWYNSAGNWNTVNITPKDKLLTREQRRKEFALLRDMGIKGVKIDFFGGDDQSMIGYYLDILDDAADYGLLVNFHGCTLPRGWQRTYPHLMTMESIKGFEFITFEQANADEEPAHAATIPFTRNIFDPMDFTPMALHSIPKINRRTTAAFELALSVVFLSGIQHFAETPEGMAAMPGFVKDYLRQLPAYWEDTRFLDGYPGRYFAVARRSGQRWYLAAINGGTEPRSLQLDCSFLPPNKKIILLADGPAGSLTRQELTLPANKKLPVTLPPHGGLVLLVD